MAEWREVGITSQCTPIDGKILLPSGTDGGGLVLVDAAGKKVLLSSGERGDAGTAACVPGALLKAFGGSQATIKYRAAGILDVLWRRRWLWVELAIIVVTLLGAILGAVVSFTGDRASDNETAAQLAFTTFVIALGLAVLNFGKSVHDALKG